MTVEYEINADFDLSLRPRWRGPASPSEALRIEEMACHVLFMGASEESVRVPGEIPEEFLASLEQSGFTAPQLAVRPAISHHRQLLPFGWNTAAHRLNLEYARPAPHPPLDSVRKVNSRSFSAGLEELIDGPRFHLGEWRSVDELSTELRTLGERPHGWVAKADHGNAGLGNRRLRSRELTEADRRWLKSMLAEDDLVVLEPWVRRERDLCTTFDVSSDATISELEIHELVNTSDGAFIGALFEGRSTVVEKCRDDLERAIDMVAKRLVAEGYFGPVCLDSFVYREQSTASLRAVADLNARLHMSLPARRLWRSWDRARVVYWRFFGRRKLALPDDVERVVRELADDAFDPELGRGVLVTSPLWFLADGGRRRPHKIGVLMVGDTRADVLAQERRFRGRFER